MVKKKFPTTTVLITIFVIGILSIAGIYFFMFKEDELSGLQVHYYKDGIEVFPQSFLQTFVGSLDIDIDQISFSIIGENTGGVNLDMKIVDASPQLFKDALPITTQILAPGETKVLWTSELIDTAQFESYLQPVNFWINFSGEYSSFIDPIYEQSSIDLEFYSLPSLIVTGTITLDGTHEYGRVVVHPGGVINVGNLGWLNITANDITILGTINSKNIFSGNGNGGGGRTEMWYSGQWLELAGGGGGAGHGGKGDGGASYQTAGGGGGGAMYGNPSDFSVTSGSRGGNGGGSRGGGGGLGSGWLQLTGKDVTISGTLNFRGSNGGGGSSTSGVTGGGGGGGSAGTILIKGENINLDNANINLQGGSGGGGAVNAGNGGSGAGGRFKIFYENTISNIGISVNIGSGTIHYGQI